MTAAEVTLAALLPADVGAKAADPATVRLTVHEDGVRYQVFRGPREVLDAVAPTAAEALRIAAVSP